MIQGKLWRPREKGPLMLEFQQRLAVENSIVSFREM